MRVIVLGIGNTILTDDGIGVYVARKVKNQLNSMGIEVLESNIAGFALIELLAGYDRAVIIDGARFRRHEPGDVILSDCKHFQPTLHLIAGHEIDLPTALSLGQILGVIIPREIFVIAIQVLDYVTFGEQCTPAVERAIAPAAQLTVETATKAFNST
ncbi:hydrogenase maturation protease [candidate division CSSED10-310 bacterium]|uniref:Hydrogenase maturation protease n=1 Tax=candidate division CSSED10-310 bacterium TaxID=2855610 RepID=A0ABV6YVK2_UNCC1